MNVRSVVVHYLKTELGACFAESFLHIGHGDIDTLGNIDNERREAGTFPKEGEGQPLVTSPTCRP